MRPQCIHIKMFFLLLICLGPPISTPTENPLHVTGAIDIALQLVSLSRPSYISSLDFLSSKEKQLIPLLLRLKASAAHRIKSKLASMMYKTFQTLAPPYTISCHFPQYSCHTELLNVQQICQVPVMSKSLHSLKTFFHI